MWGKISIIFLSVFVLGLSGFSQNVNAETILICQVPSNPMNAAGSPYILDTDLCGTKVIIPSSQTLVLESGAVFEIRSTTTVGGLLNFGQSPNINYVGNHEFGHFAGINHAPSTDSDSHTMMKPDCTPGYAIIRTADINQINGMY